mmetsp:Transcript_83285/g.209960  ORF Transcript_83285/g.209960 Transcript_83285/m.209960 type:complete len:245 (-) Transcript_83285:150-884(-)
MLWLQGHLWLLILLILLLGWLLLLPLILLLLLLLLLSLLVLHQESCPRYLFRKRLRFIRGLRPRGLDSNRPWLQKLCHLASCALCLCLTHRNTRRHALCPARRRPGLESETFARRGDMGAHRVQGVKVVHRGGHASPLLTDRLLQFEDLQTQSAQFHLSAVGSLHHAVHRALVLAANLVGHVIEMRHYEAVEALAALHRHGAVAPRGPGRRIVDGFAGRPVARRGRARIRLQVALPRVRLRDLE